MIRKPQTASQIGFMVYAAALVVAMHWPHLELVVDNDVVWWGLDKWGHAGLFAGWAVLLGATGWLRGGMGARFVKLLGIAVAYAVVEELTQGLTPGRTFSIEDMVASVVGAVMGSVVWRGAVWIDQPTEGFVSHARVMSALTLVSRVFGLLRDRALPYLLGFGMHLDAFMIAFLIPNLFRRLFGEGALAGAFVPHYAKLNSGSGKGSAPFAALVISGLGRVLVGLAVFSVLLLGILILSGVLDEQGERIASLTMVSVWFMPMVCVSAIMGAVLHVRGKFGVPSASPVLLNVMIIGACVMGVALLPESVSLGTKSLVVMAAVLMAGAGQLVWHAASVRSAGVALPTWKHAQQVWRKEPVVRGATRSMMKQWLPTVLGLAVFQMNTLMDAMIALFFSSPEGAEAGARMSLFGWDPVYPMQSGSVGVIGAAARLYEFPLGVFGIAVATAIFPALSRSTDDRARFGDLLKRGLRLAMYIGLPATVGLVLIRGPVSRAIYFEGGAIRADDWARVSWVLLGYTPAIWAYSLNQILVRAFYAHHEAKTPMRVSVAMVVLNIALNLTLIWLPVGEGGERLGAAGLAWSTAVCAVLQCVVLLVLIRRHVDRPIDGGVMLGWLGTGVCAAVMGAAVYGVLEWMGDGADSWWGSVWACALSVGVGAGVMVLGSLLLRKAERRWVVSRGAGD